MSDLELILYSTGEDNENSYLAIKIGNLVDIWHRLPPWVLKGKSTTRKYGNPAFGDTYQELVQRTFGFCYTAEEAWLVVYYGLQDDGDGYSERGKAKRKVWGCPWLVWGFIRHSVYAPDGSWYGDVAGADIPSWLNTRSLVKSCPRLRFQMEDFDGEIVNVTAHVQEREWRRGRGNWTWIRKFAKPLIKRSLDIKYESEIGERKRNYKGATTGHGVDLLPGETNLAALQRLFATHDSYKGARILVDSYTEDKIDAM